MARYWVGGTGNTNDITHWAATSGGAGSAGVPTAADDVYFDANSGAGTVTINAALSCRSLRTSGSSITTIVHNTSIVVSIGDGTAGAGNVALDMSGITTYTKVNGLGAVINLISSANPTTYIQTIRTGTISLGSVNIYSAANPSYILLDNLVLVGYFTFGSGFDGCSFGANDFNVTALRYTIGFGAVIYMGSGTWTINETAAATVWNCGNTAFTGIATMTSRIVIGTASANTRIFDGGGKTYNILDYTLSGSTGQLTISAGASTSNTISRLLFRDASNARTMAITAGQTLTISNFTAGDIVGTSGRLMTIRSTSGGSAATISSPYRISSDYLSLQDITGAGNLPHYAGANSTNTSGNSNFLFENAKTGSFL